MTLHLSNKIGLLFELNLSMCFVKGNMLFAKELCSCTVYTPDHRSNTSQVYNAYHSCSSGEGMSPAVPFFMFSSLPCHQLWSSLLIIWIISPTRKRIPASLHGMRSSLAGSYSNCARTNIW